MSGSDRGISERQVSDASDGTVFLEIVCGIVVIMKCYNREIAILEKSWLISLELR